MLFPPRVRVAVVGLVVAGGAAAAALLGPAGTAVGQASPPIQEQIQVNSPGTLVAKGAGVNVSITASCSGQLAESATVGVSLTEAVGKNLASGGGNATIDCTGLAQTFDVLVTAESGKAFTKGSAIADASIDACTVDFSNCVFQAVEPTIKIRK